MKKVVVFWSTTDNFVRLPLLFFLFSSALTILSPLVVYNNLPPRLPLFYSLPWGQSQLVTKQQFFILPVILIIINLTNFFIASQLHPVQSVLKKLLTLSLVLINFIILI